MNSQKIVILVLGIFLWVTSLNAGEAIKATAMPGNTQISQGETIEIPVNIDLWSLPELLGSFTATLQWDGKVLQFSGFTGGRSVGFENPVVNTAEAADGILIFANANPSGAEKLVNVLNVSFRVVGESGSSSSVFLYFTAMSAAKTYLNLLPLLDSQDENEFRLVVVDKPADYSLESFPNPFNPITVIRYNLPEPVEVNIAIYNVLGQRVRALVNKKQLAGSYTAEWDGTNEQGQMLSSGLYFLRMQAGKFAAEGKLLFLK
jgi:hypothetical protein